MTLMLHRGAAAIDTTTSASRNSTRHAKPRPDPSFQGRGLVKMSVGLYGHEIVGETHGVTEDGARYFGLLSLKSPYTGYEDTVGLRNSHDKSFPVSVGFGSRVFVCDNLAFIADKSVRTKHTAGLKLRLPGLIGEMIEPLALHREAQHRTFERYRGTVLTDQLADHAIMNLYREGVLNIQRVPEVLKEWHEPTHDEWGKGSAFHLFNATTFVLAGQAMEKLKATPKLHQVIDGVCENVA